MGTQVAILHDRLPYNSTHYFEIFASYLRRAVLKKNGCDHAVEEHALPFLSGSPLRSVSSTDDDTQEKTRFDPVKHVRHFEEVFQIYSTNIQKKTVCSIADNGNVNKFLARPLEVPHVDCLNHKINIGLNSMVASHPFLSYIIGDVYETM